MVLSLHALHHLLCSTTSLSRVALTKLSPTSCWRCVTSPTTWHYSHPTSTFVCLSVWAEGILYMCINRRALQVQAGEQVCMQVTGVKFCSLQLNCAI